jgi:hypothetical protein
MLVLGTGDAGCGVLVVGEDARDDDVTLLNCLERVSDAKVFFTAIANFCFSRCYTWQNLRSRSSQRMCSNSHALWSRKRPTPYCERSLILLAQSWRRLSIVSGL